VVSRYWDLMVINRDAPGRMLPAIPEPPQTRVHLSRHLPELRTGTQANRGIRFISNAGRLPRSAAGCAHVETDKACKLMCRDVQSMAAESLAA
jgi:hypothetical protein